MNIHEMNQIIGATPTNGQYSRVVVGLGPWSDRMLYVSYSQDDTYLWIGLLPSHDELMSQAEQQYNSMKNSAQYGGMPNKFLMMTVLETMSEEVASAELEL